MNGNKILTDTNILIYLMSGDEVLRKFLDGKQLVISVINEIEILGSNKLTSKQKVEIRELLSQLDSIKLDEYVKEKAIEIRSKYKIKLPDAIIAASSIVKDLPIITADSDYEIIDELDLIKYNF